MTNDPSSPPPMDDDPQSTPPADSTPEPAASGGSPLPTEAPPAGAVALGQGKLAENDEKLFGMLAHILGIVAGFLGPLIIWLIKKDESPFVNDQGKEGLNFQITVAIAYVIGIVISFVGGIVFAPISCVGSLLCGAAWVCSLIFAIMGGLAANKGEAYRYPFALRLVS